MKALIFSLFLSVVFSNVLAGQNELTKDPVVADKNARQQMPQITVPGDSLGFQQADTIITDKFFRQQIPGIIPKGEYKVFADQLPDTTYNPFPGSSRYYGKHPEMLPSGNHFIAKPDTSSKYFLIIRNPLTNKITR